MKSRLDTLLRQRELLREHAQWLDDEIAAERARAGGPGSAPVPPQTSNLASNSTSAVDPVVAVFSEPDVKGLHSQVRQGCLLYFLIAAGALAGLVAFVYWKYQPDVEIETSPPPVQVPAPSAIEGSR